jgi:dolichol-phosphate mannosyltransferase
MILVTDNTLQKAEKICNNNKKIVVYNNKKKGLGGAISLGIKKAKGDFVCIMMADFSDDITDLKKYYHLIKEKNLDAVFGSRFIKGSKINNYPKKKLILIEYLIFLLNYYF